MPFVPMSEDHAQLEAGVGVLLDRQPYRDEAFRVGALAEVCDLISGLAKDAVAMLVQS